MVKAKVFIYDNRFEGLPKDGDIKLVEEELPPLKNGEILTEALFLSVDPYMRGRAFLYPIGQPFQGEQVAKVIESKNPKYPIGQLVVGHFGWRTHTIIDPSVFFEEQPVRKLPPLGDLSPSLALGVLGMPGNTAYFGFLEICKPKPGETVVVSGAAGAVGSLVGQIAKIKGCKVVGIAGSDEKGKWLKEELHFDEFINYKTEDVEEALKKAAPKGVNCYFDNVGGEISSIVLDQMASHGRVSVCGCISAYNATSKPQADVIQFSLIKSECKVEGFMVSRWYNRWDEGILQNIKWIKEGKLKYQETVTDGFKNMPKAFSEMLQGLGVGKAVVKA